MPVIITPPAEFPGELVRTVDVLAEPCLIVTGEGAVLFANRAARDHWNLDIGATLARIDPDDRLLAHIAKAARSSAPIVARLALARGNRGWETLRCYGNLIRLASAPAERWVLLRFVAGADRNFGTLTEKVAELARENLRRREVQADLEAALAHRDLLVRELKHRVKNLFAIIISLVTLSMRGSGDFDTKARGLAKRIMALSRAHDVGSAEQFETGQDLETLSRMVLEPFAVTTGERIACYGPKIRVPADLVTTLGLILHEWGVNAFK